ncbi:MAG: High-affinity choline uptake protein BetT [uncultured Rubrobacteraceae bacterium]|uniref:High-affinity choline uptake protein BetT n=1 Tax=uncultured Rubrobacteraceae bacterium TaxID=349277 RepID=A0A6J4PRH2_9ACTN|nr:MAG: High-affinity choline uptake protein BetT [uncultured Rubrobacteraceae bacterium]
MSNTQIEGEQARRDGSPQGDGQAQQFGTVFYITVAISVLFVLAGVFFTEPFGNALATVVGWITEGLGWLYMLMTSFFLGFAIWLALSRYGKIRLGRPDDRPEFGYFAWFAMLFQAGMGIGLVFWSVSEPVTHYADPPLGMAQPETAGAASLALQTAFFHWGLHPWAIYAVVGLAVAYFSYRRGMTNLQISTVFRPLIGDRVDGPLGKAIDIIAILATLFGVAVSLGLGTLQIDAGLGEAFGLPSGVGLQMGIIAVTAVAYMLSASTPINKGVNILSQTSMLLAFVLLVYFLIVGPTLLQLNTFTQETGGYLANLIPRSFDMAAFEPQEATWLADWTIFFWATWIAWAPYVGVFVARISRGRTIREFILGVMIAPTIFSMIWFSVFGAAGIQADNQTNGAISSAAGNSEALGLFAFLGQSPLFLLTSVSMIFLVWIFFVAGADAGTIVLGSMSAGGAPDPKRRIKLTWGVIMGALAAILLLVGGLDALQNGAILAATPFAILMCLMCWCLYKTLRSDYRDEREQIRQIMAHDQNVEKSQMQEIMRRHEAGEPVRQRAGDRDG